MPQSARIDEARLGPSRRLSPGVATPGTGRDDVSSVRSRLDLNGLVVAIGEDLVEGSMEWPATSESAVAMDESRTAVRAAEVHVGLPGLRYAEVAIVEFAKYVRLAAAGLLVSPGGDTGPLGGAAAPPLVVPRNRVALVRVERRCLGVRGSRCGSPPEMPLDADTTERRQASVPMRVMSGRSAGRSGTYR